MSFLSIKNFITSGHESLEKKNYWSALSVALMLPSICSRLTYGDEEYKSSNQNDNTGYWYTDRANKIHWKDKKCYIDWCNEYIKHGREDLCLGEDYAEVLYELRCNIVHAGCADIHADGKSIYLSFGNAIPTTEFEKYRIINVPDMCTIIFACANTWCSLFCASNLKYTRVFNGESNDDKLLYNKLCNEERANYLKNSLTKKSTIYESSV